MHCTFKRSQHLNVTKLRTGPFFFFFFSGVVQTQAEAEKKIKQVLSSVNRETEPARPYEPNSTTFQGKKKNYFSVTFFFISKRHFLKETFSV